MRSTEGYWFGQDFPPCGRSLPAYRLTSMAEDGEAEGGESDNEEAGDVVEEQVVRAEVLFDGQRQGCEEDHVDQPGQQRPPDMPSALGEAAGLLVGGRVQIVTIGAARNAVWNVVQNVDMRSLILHFASRSAA